MHPYLVTRLELADAPDAEMPDAAFSQLNMADAEMADADDAGSNNHPARPADMRHHDMRHLPPHPLHHATHCFTYTARSVAVEPRFMLFLHHLREAVERRDDRQIEFQLRRILKLTFFVDEADLEIGAADAWANVDMRLQALRGGNDPGMLGPYEAAFASPAGRHRVRDLPRGHLRPYRGRVGVLELPRRPVPAEQGWVPVLRLRPRRLLRFGCRGVRLVRRGHL